MLTIEQKLLRQTGVSASEIAIVIGVSPFRKTVEDLIIEKIGAVEEDDMTEAQELGHTFERPILDKWLSGSSDRKLIEYPCGTVVHPDYSYILATPDAVVEVGGERQLAEIKLVSSYMAHHWDKDSIGGVPDYVYTQAQLQLACKQMQVDNIAALIDMQYYEFVVKFNVEVFEKLRRQALAFMESIWNETYDYDNQKLRAYFQQLHAPDSNGEMLPANEYSLLAAQKYLEATELVARAESLKERRKNDLIEMIADADGIDGVATYRSGKGGKRYFKFNYKGE